MNTETQIISPMQGIVGVQEALLGLREQKSIADQILENKSVQDFKAAKTDMCRVDLKTAILSSGAVNDRLKPSHTPAIDPGTRRPLNIRSLLREFAIEQGAVEVPVASSKTNNAAVTVAGSPEQYENVTMGESAYTFTTSFTEVRTLGHFVPVSAQILEDAGQLDSFLTGELTYGLERAVEAQLLNGSGSNGQLSGLITGATSYSAGSPAAASDVQTIRDALRQVEVADFTPSAIVLHPQNWFQIEADLSSTSAPRTAGMPRLYGVPVVVSTAISANTYLLGDFQRCGALFVRQGTLVEMARNDDTGFQKNMVTIKATTRLACVVTNATALVTGSI